MIMKDGNNAFNDDAVFYNSKLYSNNTNQNRRFQNENNMFTERTSGESGVPFIFVHIPSHASCSEAPEHQEVSFTRTHQENRDDIKCEPIKSESNEANLNGPPKIQFSQHSQSNNCLKPLKCIDTSNLVLARPKPKTQTHKCGKCPYITTSQDNLYVHMNTCDIRMEMLEPSKLICPGCENVFYNKISLQVHLEHDHKMLQIEINPLIENVVSNAARKASQNARRNGELINILNGFPSSLPSENQLVEETEDRHILPDYDNNENDFVFNDTHEDDSIMEVTPTICDLDTQLSEKGSSKGKIYISNIDILRKPSSCDDVNLVRTDNDNSMNSRTPDSCYEANFPESEEENVYNFGVEHESSSKQTNSQKIYIKNVNILNRPNPDKFSSYNNVLQNEIETEGFLPLFTKEQSQLPATYVQCEASNFFSQGKTTNNFFINPATSVNNIPKKTMNSLHLRTVDELNLLNVKDLMTPTTVLDSVDLVTDENMASGENTKVDCLHCPIEPCKDIVNSREDNVSFANYSDNANQNEKSVSNEDRDQQNWLERNISEEFTNIVESKSPPRNFLGKTMNNFEGDLNTPQRVVTDDHEPLFLNDNDKTPDFASWGFYSVENCTPCMEENVEKNEDSRIVDISDDIESSQENDLHTSTATMPERGRIYVADNLLKHSNKPQTETISEPSPIKPERSKQIITKLRKLYANVDPDEKRHKCEFDCGNRFQEIEKLEYHKKCHVNSSPRQMRCPECMMNTFRIWDTLHTHLWQRHQIDMELYSCSYCNFKTPMLSRLINTHVKIHSEERNFKCTICEKMFKNNRQLKNHRRVHKKVRKVHKCLECNATFSQSSAFQEHYRRTHSLVTEFKCPNCSDVFSSKEDLKTHQLVAHKNTAKYQCGDCGYKTNDRSAFRRHSMIHVASKKYSCPYCDYKCIQSNVYRRHISKLHPERENEIILKCKHCNFTTINRVNFETHIARHMDISSEQFGNEGIHSSTFQCQPNDVSTSTVQTENVFKKPEPEKPKETELVNKIKVRSNLSLTDPNKLINPNLFILKTVK